MHVQVAVMGAPWLVRPVDLVQRPPTRAADPPLHRRQTHAASPRHHAQRVALADGRHHATPPLLPITFLRMPHLGSGSREI